MNRFGDSGIGRRASRMLAVVLVGAITQPAWLWAASRVPELPDPGKVAVSKQEQIQVGQKAVSEVYKQMPILPDSSPLTVYVQRLGKRLAAVIPQQNSWPFQFHVVQQKEVNAFAIPGGPIFVNVGTITTADNEAQLAGVMAHEIAHVYMQHSVKQMQKNTLPSILAGLGGILGQMIGGVGGAIAQMGGQISGGLLSMKYSRADEAQADQVGAIIAYKANYNPVELAKFFEKLEQEGGGRGPQFMSDHPNPGNRLQAIQAEVRDWPARSFANTAEFARAKQQAKGTRVYTAQEIAQMAKSGQIHNAGVPAGVQTAPSGPAQGAEASADFQSLQHNAFTVQYPSNWQVYGDQNSSVTIAPEGGVAQNAVAYGAILNGFQPQAGDLDGAFQELVASIRQGNPEVRGVGSAQTIRVNGVQGKSMELIGPSPLQQNGQPAQERDWLVAVPNSQGALIYAVFVAPERDFGKLRPTFEKMLRTLRVK